MKTQLGDYIRKRRKALGYSWQDVARAAGYRNLNKGARRVQCLEENGSGHQALLDNVLKALELSRETARDCYFADERQRRADWEAWADELIRPLLSWNEGPIFVRAFTVKRVPESASSPEKAEAYACEYARRHERRMRLIVTRRNAICIDRNGHVTSRDTFGYDNPVMPPMLAIRGRQLTLFDGEAPARPDDR